MLTIDQGTRLTTTATETATPPANTQNRTASIELNANTMNLFGTVEILSETQGDAQAGTLTLRPKNGDNLTINLADQSRVSASTSSNGQGGSLFLTTPNNITVSGDGTLSAEASGEGKAGRVQVQAQQFTIQDGATLSTLTTGPGAGGEINIDADRVAVINSTITAETEGSGNAGSILFSPQADGRSLTIDFGDSTNSNITAETTATGNGGNIALNAPNSITITGQGTLNAQTSSTSAAGKVDITTNQLTVDQGTRLSTTATQNAKPPANTGSPVPGGSISLSADQMNLFGEVRVLSETEGAAPAGQIALKPNTGSDLRIDFEENSLVSTSSSGSGPGGDLTISAPDGVLTISGQGRLSAETSGDGPAGTVLVEAQQFTLQDGAEISTRTTGAGEGGSLRLNIGNGTTQLNNAKLIADSTQPDDTLAGSLSLQTGQLNLNNSLIDVRNAGNDAGGNIDIRSNQAAILTNQSSIQTNATGNGNGGNIFVRTPFLSAPVGENSDIIANAIAGSGGNITIEADSVVNFQLRDEPEPALRSNNTNDISASSELGIDGTLSLDGFNVDPSQGAAELPITLPDPSNQIANRCSPTELARSEFIITGRNGIPKSPSEPLELAGASPSPWLDLPNAPAVEANHNFPQTDQPQPRAIAEASQWQIDKDGQVRLVATAISEPNTLSPTVCAAKAVQAQ